MIFIYVLMSIAAMGCPVGAPGPSFCPYKQSKCVCQNEENVCLKYSDKKKKCVLWTKWCLDWKKPVSK